MTPAQSSDPTVPQTTPTGTTPTNAMNDNDADAGTDAAIVPAGPASTATSETMQVSGTSRSYLLGVPNAYDASKSYPLVLVLHGDGGDGVGMREALPVEAAAAGAAIVAYPNGVGGFWDLYGPASGDADDAFVGQLVDALRARFNIGAVFGTGFSSGAFMVNQIACRRPSLFRAIAPHSGGAPSEPQDPTASRWPNGFTKCAAQTDGSGPAVMVVHGTADSVVTFDSGDFTSTYWGYVDGCQAGRSAPAPSPCVGQDGCPAGKPVIMCAIPNLDHAIWPDAGKAIWMFFSHL